MSFVTKVTGAAMLVALSACASIERAAIPTAQVTDSDWLAFTPGSSEIVDHSAWNAFLSTYRVEGLDGIARLRYAAVTEADLAALESYISALEQVDVAALDRPEQLAYWINLYNAKTVALVLRDYPVNTIRRVDGGLLATGPWNRDVVEVDGRALSLNDIEHTIVRPIWQDARVHYAFNCAALGCPNLIAEAYTGETIDEVLDENARAYVNDPRGFHFEGDRLTASRIYVWFVEDFGGTEAGVLEHAARYAEPELGERLLEAGRINSYEYDWGLNDAS
ncbi:MAG: DUF547 domain-containing protein [Pseudomonadota bacterium]